MNAVAVLSLVIVVLAVLAILGWISYQCERDDNKRLSKELAARKRELPNYEWATLEDRFAERAMQALVETQRVQPGGLDMTLEKLTDEAYRIARFMLQARAFRKV